MHTLFWETIFGIFGLPQMLEPVAKSDGKKYKKKEGKRERGKDRKTERQKDRKTERQKDRKTERQKDRKTERQSLPSFYASNILSMF